MLFMIVYETILLEVFLSFVPALARAKSLAIPRHHESITVHCLILKSQIVIKAGLDSAIYSQNNSTAQIMTSIRYCYSRERGEETLPRQH